MTKPSDKYFSGPAPAAPASPSSRYFDAPDAPRPLAGADDVDPAVYQSALAKKKAGKTLTRQEAQALAKMEGGRKTLVGIGVALQPFQALSDITKGLIGQARGIPNAANRGAGAAAGHLTYGLAEFLPGATGARAQGVTGAELLRGTRYEGNASAALAVELLADPSLLLAGAGVAAKGGATAGRLAQLEKLGKTPEGAALIRNALIAANKRGDDLLWASDEITGVPAVTRGVARGPVGQAAKGAASKLADTTMPAPLQRVTGVRTYGDAFFTPDQKASTYTPEQLARDEFRNTTRLGVDDTRLGINAEVNAQTPVLRDLFKGLKPDDAQEVNRLLGVFTTATKPDVAAEALRKLNALGSRVGKPLEKPFVQAVKALDSVGQNTTGARLAAEGLPTLVDPTVAKAIQDAETGADLLPLIGRYTSADGRPRGIVMTQYTGRADPDKAIAQIKSGPEIPALATVDEATLAPRLAGTLEDVPVPARPVEPVAVAPKGAPPLNPAGRAAQVAETPVSTAAPASDLTPKAPSQVIEELFGPSSAPARTAPAPTPDPAATPPAPTNTRSPTDFTPPARTPASVIEETLSPAPPAPPQEPTYIDLSGMGGAITDNMYDMLYGRYVAGKVDEAGKPSNVLQGAAQLKARGVDLTREQFPDFARDLTQTISATRGTPDFADQMRRFFDDYKPGVKATPSPEPVSAIPAEIVPDDVLFKVGDEADIEAGLLLADRPKSLKSKLPTFQHFIDSPSGNALVSNGEYAVIASRGKQAPAPGEIQFSYLDEHARIPVEPAAVARHGVQDFVWFSNARAVPLEYFDDLTRRYPDATYRTSPGGEYIVAYQEGTLVGLLPGKRRVPPRNLQSQRTAAASPRREEALGSGAALHPTPTSPELERLLAQKKYLEASLDAAIYAGDSTRHISRSLADVDAQIAGLAPSPPASLKPSAPTPQSSVTKTPAAVLQDVLSPGNPDPFVALPDPTIRRTPQDDVRPLALPAVPSPERLVGRAVPTTYRTVEVDANTLDWAALPDDSARRAVLNSLEGAGNARFVRDQSGALRLDRPNLTVPLNHPTISRYFSDDNLMAAQRTGTDLGERTIVRREQVPDWYNPRDPAPLEVQRALREQAQQEAADAAFPNDLAQITRNLESRDELDNWTVGDAYASYDRLVMPERINTRAASNDYAARVKALTGNPPTRGEVFQYRLALARYRQAANLRTLNTTDAARHLAEFYRQNPEATLWEGVLSAARAFDLGKVGAKHLQRVLAQADSGFTRQMSRLERLEFAQFVKAKDTGRRSVPGGLLIDRLKRRPEEVSREFEQVFPQELNAMKLLDEQVRTRTAAIVRAQMLREYHAHLTETGQHLTARQIKELRTIPPSRLDPKQRALRESIAGANEQGGAPAGWKIMDREIGPFAKDDAVPWWAYHDLFGASSVDDAAVGAAILSRNTPGGTYDRLWRSMNAQMLGSPSSIVNDQVGQLLQMGMWGVTPDAVIEGMVRRARATPGELDAMRHSGIQSATLEASVGADRMDLSRLAQRLEGDTDKSRLERVLDPLLRFRERGTGLDPQAMTGAAGVAADVAHLGSGYAFRLRSRMSDLQRESLYFHRIAVGDTPAQAARYANEVLMDMRLVPAYARVVSRYWPFFNWIAMSGPRSIVSILRKPSIAAAYHRLPKASDQDDPDADAKRVLARDGGYINLNPLGVQDRDGAGVYLDLRGWDPTNTIPQLLDWNGTKVGPVDLPWYLNLAKSIGWGVDRYGGTVYGEVLGGERGGFADAFKVNPARTLAVAARTIHAQFNPSYAPGSTRARTLVQSILRTAELPQDGSKDIALAHSLANSPQGRAWLLYMQYGSLAVIERDLRANRGGQYQTAPPGVGVALGGFILPLRTVNPDQDVQGAAQQGISLEMLKYQQWLSGEKKRLAELEAAGASPEKIRAAEDRILRQADRRGSRIDYLDQITR